MKSRLVLVMCFLIAGLWAQARAGDPEALGDKLAPTPVQKVNPVYPPEAREKGIQGSVILDAVINEKGDVIQVELHTDKDKEKGTVAEQPDPLLAKAAMDAVKQWKYEPYKDASGKVVSVRFSVTINFKLK